MSRKRTTIIKKRAGNIHVTFSEADGRNIARQLRKGYGFLGDVDIKACTCHALAEGDRPCAWCETHPIPYVLAERTVTLDQGPVPGKCVDCGKDLPDNRRICDDCLEQRR